MYMYTYRLIYDIDNRLILFPFVIEEALREKTQNTRNQEPLVQVPLQANGTLKKVNGLNATQYSEFYSYYKYSF